MKEQDRVKEFIDKLKFGGPQERREVVEVINELKDPNLLPVLMEIINGNDPTEVKIAAIRCVVNIGEETTIKSLIDVSLNDDDKWLKMEAIRALGMFKHDMAIPSLTKLVNRSDDEDIIQLASSAIQVIQGISPDYIID